MYLTRLEKASVQYLADEIVSAYPVLQDLTSHRRMDLQIGGKARNPVLRPGT